MVSGPTSASASITPVFRSQTVLIIIDIVYPGATDLKDAVMSAKQQAMERINQFMAENKQDPIAAEEVNIMEEEVPDEIDDADDEIQKLAGEASHKQKKRKTGF